MNQKHRTLAVVAVALAVLALVLWKVRGGSEARPSADHQAVATGTSGASSAPRARERRGPVRPGTVSGRVTRAADGSPIANAQVSLVAASLGSVLIDRDDLAPITLVTDRDGRWTSSNVRPATYTLSASAKGFITGFRNRIVVAEESRQAFDLALNAGGIVVSGSVLDVGGGPISGAKVYAKRESFQSLFSGGSTLAISDDAGRYEMTVEPGSFWLAAGHDDYTDAIEEIEVIADPVMHDFTLVPGSTVEGVVVMRDGSPVPGAMIWAVGGRGIDGGSFGMTAADDQGEFLIKKLGSGAIKLTAMGRGGASTTPTTVEIGIGERVEGVRIVVDRAYSISGTVVDRTTKKPVEGVQLGVFSLQGGGRAAIARDPSAADGSFEILGVPAGNHMLFAFGEEVVPEIGKPIEIKDRDVTGVVVEMGVGVTVSGRVEPARVAKVSIALKNVGLANMFDAMKTAMVQTDTDASGAFTLTHVPAGAFVVTATTRAGDKGAVDVVVGTEDKRDIVVQLERQASISGRVVTAKGSAVAGVRVSARAQKDEGKNTFAMSFDVGGGGNDSGTTKSDGSFELVGLGAGKYDVRVADAHGTLRWADAAHAGKGTTQPVVVEVAEKTAKTGVTLTVEASDGVIRGNVSGPDGNPAADAWVKLEMTRAKDEDIDWESRQPGGRIPVLTGADGRFTFSGLRKGTYRVIADGSRGASHGEVEGVTPGSSVTVKLASLGTLTGIVTVAGAPVPSYDIECETDRDDEVEKHVSEPTGAYRLERVAPGEYECDVDSDAGRGKAKVKVPAGEAKLDIALEPWGTLTGRVVSVLTKQPVKDVVVITEGNRSGEQQVLEIMTGTGGPGTDVDGRFTIKRVAAGKGELIVLPRGAAFQQLAKKSYEVGSGATTDLGTIEVIPPRTGEAGTLGMSTEVKDGALLVDTVRPGGPAEAAGIAAGDRITAINGAPLAGFDPEIAKLLLSSGSMSPGEKFLLGLERGGTATQATVTSVKW